jgi:hypothetical protein
MSEEKKKNKSFGIRLKKIAKLQFFSELLIVSLVVLHHVYGAYK